MSLFLFSIYHTCPLLRLGTTSLERTTPLQFQVNLAQRVPFLNHTSPLFLFDTLSPSGRATVGPLSAACASTLVPGRQDDSCSCLGFLAPMSKWVACASSHTLGHVKYCDSLVNSTVCRIGNPGTAKPTNNYSIYNCLLLCMCVSWKKSDIYKRINVTLPCAFALITFLP